jgi:cation diffusion facilitator family transporter
MSSSREDITGTAHEPHANTGHRHDHSPDGHDHEHAHSHGHVDGDDQGHQHPGGMRGLLAGLFRPHSHDPADQVDSALAASAEGMRALKVSLAGLAVTAAAQLAVFLASGSVALLADTVHNFADALTAVPIGIAFLAGRRPASRRYTYGYGRSEDIAGLFVLLAMTASSVLAAYEAVSRLIHPRGLHDLAWVAVAGIVGFIGNELVAVYRIRVGRRIGSAALVADGLHARTDGLTSLAVVVGAVGVAAGWRPADPAAGILISIAIFGVLRQAAREVYGRIMDRVDDAALSSAERTVRLVRGVSSIDRLRMRWVGHDLLAEIDISADPALTLPQAHDIAENVRHRLLHDIRRLADATIHVSPQPNEANDPHQQTSHHFSAGTAGAVANKDRK